MRSRETRIRRFIARKNMPDGRTRVSMVVIGLQQVIRRYRPRERDANLKSLTGFLAPVIRNESKSGARNPYA